jgi:hypothetical protein
MNHDEMLTYYATPGVFTSVDGFKGEVAQIPSDTGSIASAVQNILIHEAWAPAYGVDLSPERRAEKEIHSAVAMLKQAVALKDQPISAPRAADLRVVGVCRHFATLFVAFMRQKKMPARVRCGFANYFEAGKHVDHWVGEFWDDTQGRWVLVDAQLDDRQEALAKTDFETLDVPRDRFLVAGDAWRACRTDAVDSLTFGVGGTDMWGLVEVMGDVFQDVAALQSVELLPWGWYGLAAADDAWSGELDLIDHVALLSSVADVGALSELRKLTAADPRLALPSARVNATRDAELARSA